MGKQEVVQYLSSKTWQFTYDRRMSYQRMKLFNYGYCQQLSTFFKVDLNSEIYRVKEGNVSVYYELNDHKKAFSEIEIRLLNKKSLPLIEEIHRIILDYYREFKQEIENKQIDYSLSTNKELAEACDAFFKLNERISLPTWLLYLYFEEILSSSLKTLLLEKKIGSDEVERIITTLSQPGSIIPLDAYHRDLYEVVLGKQKIEEVAEKYMSWGVYDVNYETPDIEFHTDEVADISSERASLLLDELDRKYKKQNVEIETVKEEWRSDAYIFALIDLYSFYATFKDWKNYYREQSSYKLKILFKEIAGRLSLTPEQVSFMTEEEIKGVLLGTLRINSDEISRRTRESAFVFVNGELSIVTDVNELRDIDGYLVLKSASSLKGISVYPGVIEGIAKIIFTTDDFKKVSEGDILVSSTTRPDYLPFMKKAGGFITNEGGMLSHAAILARELKKPCVVGTKVATKILKDGDLVEVDANKGVVRILKG